jgi:hypothetical protein
MYILLELLLYPQYSLVVMKHLIIVVLVHVVKGHQYSTYTVPSQIQRWSLESTLDLDSDKFRFFNHRDELDSAVYRQFNSKLQIMARCAMMRAGTWDACYIAIVQS